MERAAGVLETEALEGIKQDVEYRLLQLETSTATQESYARVLCGFYDDHRRTMDVLARSRQRDWTMSEAALASFRGSVDRVLTEAVSTFHSEHARAEALRLYRAT